MGYKKKTANEIIKSLNCGSTSSMADSNDTIRTANEPEAMNINDIAFGVEPKSQNVDSSQLSSQTFMAQMEKRFHFYKCDKITINFQPSFHEQKKIKNNLQDPRCIDF